MAFRKGDGAEKRTRLLFNEMTRREYRAGPWRRMGRLEDGGLVRVHYIGNAPKAYTLSELGHRLLRITGRAKLSVFRRSIADGLTRHEVLANAVGLVMQEVLGLTVRTVRERFVWSSRGGWNPGPRRGISDLWIVDSEQPKCVEVELSQKSWREYQEIWRAYRSRLGRGGVVLYLTGWQSGVERLTDYAERFGMGFIYSCYIRDFRDSCGEAPFKGSRPGQVLYLGNEGRPRAAAEHGMEPRYDLPLGVVEEVV